MFGKNSERAVLTSETPLGGESFCGLRGGGGGGGGGNGSGGTNRDISSVTWPQVDSSIWFSCQLSVTEQLVVL